MPSCTAVATCFGRDSSSASATRARRMTSSREPAPARRRAARPASPSARRLRNSLPSPVPTPVRPWAPRLPSPSDEDQLSSTTSFRPSWSPSSRPSVATRRACSSTTARRVTSGTARSRELPDELGDELVVVNDTRVVPARLAARPAKRRRGRGAARRARSPTTSGKRSRGPSRRLRAGERLGAAVELLEALGDGRWRVRLDGEPSVSLPLPPYIHEPLADPERYQTVSTRPIAGSAAAPTAGLHFTPSCSRASTSSASRSTSGSTRSARSRPRPSRRTSSTASATASSRRPGRGSRRPSACSRSGRRRPASSRRSRRGGPLAGRVRPLHPAGLHVPPRRRAPDELPPAPVDAARARDGVRGRRRAHASSTPSRSASATASTPSAMRC